MLNFNFSIIFPRNTVSTSEIIKKTSININGMGNSIIICEKSSLENCHFIISGNANYVMIGKSCRLRDTTFWIEDNEGKIKIGDGTTISGRTEFAVIEGCSIELGEDCMLANDITFRTGDSHSIIDANGTRVNPSQDIIIGNHVWIGAESTLLKGVKINDNCIVGARSLITKNSYHSNCIIAGAPATIVKENVNWLRERI